MPHTASAQPKPNDVSCTPWAVAQYADVLGKAAESAPVLIIICRKSDLGIVYVNGAARQTLDPEGHADFAAMDLLDFMGVSSASQLKGDILLHAGLMGKWKGSCTLRDIWGSEFSVTASCTSHPADASNATALFCLAATRQTVSGQTVADATSDHELLHALMETLPDTVYFKDLHSRFIRVNRAQVRKNGLTSSAELIGLTDFDRFTIEHAQQAYDDEQQIIRTGLPLIDREEKETWPDGHVTWVSTTKMPLRDATGQIIGTFGISHDITKRKLAEQSHGEMQAQLQLAQKLESIGRLAAGVAHEINTPTQFIADNMRFLTEAFGKIEAVFAQYRALRTAAAESPGCAAAVQATHSIEQEVELEYYSKEIPGCLKQSLDGLARVARIVQSLKEFAHPNSPDLTPSDLNKAIETSIMVSRHEWKYVSEVVTDLSPDLPLVPCVVDEFNQVMLNLIVNAAHAIGDALKLRGGEKGKITVRTRLEGAWAVVEVEDTGTGIPDEIRKRVFEPFFTTKSVGKGTGQGLAIVQTVVAKHHHGTVELTSEVGCGSKFILRFPLVTPEPPVA